jgi:serine/threonine protein kinase
MDDYEFIKNIGSGMFGQVFLVKHKVEDKHYAMKKINFRDLSDKDRENLENEVQVLKDLRHPNIVTYKDSFFDKEDFFYIAMIYCDGGDFYNKIKNSKGKNFPENEIIEWIVQLGLALSYIHDKKILHRDLKTQNIFIKDNKIRIGDFGISKIFNQTKDLAGSMVGTPLYMSPEQYSSKKYGFKSDIWAFGCCLYEMCNLKHAFEGSV